MGVPGCEVLIVEDDQLVAEAIRDGVLLVGYSVCGLARDLKSAITLTRLHRPRLAIIDFDLGIGGDGIEAARRMLRIAPMGIMYVTGHPHRIQKAEVGHAWMPKPYRVLDLINALAVVRDLSGGVPPSAPVPPDLHLLSR